MKKILSLLAVSVLSTTSIVNITRVDKSSYNKPFLKEAINIYNNQDLKINNDHIIYVPGTKLVIYSDDIVLMYHHKSSSTSIHTWGNNFVLLINSRTARMLKDLKNENVRDVLHIFIVIFGGCLTEENNKIKISLDLPDSNSGVLNKLEVLINKFWYNQELFIRNVKTYNDYDDIALAVADNYNTGDIGLGNFELNIIRDRNIESWLVFD